MAWHSKRAVAPRLRSPGFLGIRPGLAARSADPLLPHQRCAGLALLTV